MTRNDRHHKVDAMVATAVDAARAFRELDQRQVDRIVDAMVKAGTRGPRAGETGHRGDRLQSLRGQSGHVQVFSDVQPEPGEATIQRGVALLERARPDLIVAIGGGSVIDAAKAMGLFHEHPDKTLKELTLPFLDPRKRIAENSREPQTVQLVAVPTTSGTGSEVSPAAVVTVGNRKETLVDFCLVPDAAIVNPY